MRVSCAPVALAIVFLAASVASPAIANGQSQRPGKGAERRVAVYGPWRSTNEVPAKCVVPLDVTVGVVDSRFGLSPSDVESAITDAIADWARAAGRPLLTLSASRGVPVNFVYDARHVREIARRAALQALGDRQRALDARRSVYDSAVARITAQQVATEAQRQVYLDSSRVIGQRNAARNAEIEAFNTAAHAYDAAVMTYNRDVAAATAPSTESQARAAALRLERQRLDSIGPRLRVDADAFAVVLKRLAAQRGAVNARVDADNREVDRLKLVLAPIKAEQDALKKATDDYNRRFATGQSHAPGDITAGHYVIDAAGARVDIFTFEDARNLRLILAHEFGHALGLEHIESPSAIMFVRTTEAQTKVMPADLEAYAKRCPQ